MRLTIERLATARARQRAANIHLLRAKCKSEPTIDVVTTICALLVLVTPAGGLAQTNADHTGFVDSLKIDFRYHYSAEPLIDVALGFGVTAVLANSDADKDIQRFFREKLQGRAGDSLTDMFTDVGDVSQPMYAIPIYLGAMWAGRYNSESESMAARWGANSLRAVLVGAPELIVLENLAGGRRPEDGEPGWRPFDDDNAVSGHAFFGAVPLITAARMTDERWLQYTLYATSTLPGLARIYDDKHYFSQAFMGWWLAHVAARTVEHTNLDDESGARIVPLPYPDGGGLQFNMRF